VIDTDRVAREVLAPGTPGALAVLKHFGAGIQAPDGSIDRQALAAVVFADPGQRAVLEAISHPLVHEQVSRRVAELGDTVIVVEVPLLDAARRDQYGFHVVVLVEVLPATAVRRAMGRGMAEHDVRARMAAQPTAAQRRQVADRTLGNDGTRADLEAAVDGLWAWLQARSSHP
jgi:dephospho-CoA kinase